MAKSKKSLLHRLKRFVTTPLFILVLFAAAFAGIGTRLLDRPEAATTVVAATGTYTSFDWPAASQGYRRMDWTLIPRTDPSRDGYFWSSQFWFQNGNGGYFGLQTKGSVPTGKIALFSIWDSLASTSPQYASTFGGEGTGYTARISYPWAAGKAYRLRIVKDNTEADGTWWKAMISDNYGDTFRTVGRIKVPLAWGNLQQYSTSFTERYTGPNTKCSDIQHAAAVFKNFEAVRAGDGVKVAAISHRNSLYTATPTCGNSYITDLAAGAEHHVGKSH